MARGGNQRKGQSGGQRGGNQQNGGGRAGNNQNRQPQGGGNNRQGGGRGNGNNNDDCRRHPGQHTWPNCPDNCRNNNDASGHQGQRANNNTPNNGRQNSARQDSSRPYSDNNQPGTDSNPNHHVPYEMQYMYQNDRSQRVADAVNNYCPLCNVQGHSLSGCQRPLDGLGKNHCSTFFCRGCSTKGHLSDDCRNPISARCNKCFRKGHVAIECKVNPNPDDEARIRLAASKTGGRYRWKLQDSALHPSQKAREDWEQAKANALKGGYQIPADEVARYKYEIYNAERLLFPERFSSRTFFAHAPQVSMPYTPTYNSPQPPNYSPPPPYAYTPPPPPPPHGSPPGPVAAPGHNPTARAKRAAENRATLDMMRRNPTQYKLDMIRRFEEFAAKEDEALKTELEKKIDAKIHFAFSMYIFQKANNWIIQNEALILQNTGLTQERFDTIKDAMLRGAEIFRDPQAVVAMFKRQRPRCKSCSKDGQIVDRWFNPVPTSNWKESYLSVEDFEDWGIFIGFPCKCCSKLEANVRIPNFEYVPCPVTDLQGLPEEER